MSLHSFGVLPEATFLSPSFFRYQTHKGPRKLFGFPWHPPECLFYKTKSGCRFGEKCSYAHRQVDEQPTKRSKKNEDEIHLNVSFLMHDNWVAYFRT